MPSSMSATPSPRQWPAGQIDESQLPAGQCRYILLEPEVKSQRCACTHFNLNRSTPSASCDCGHLACYHVSSSEPLPSAESQEIVLMKKRLDFLERERTEVHQIRHEFGLLKERIGQDHDRHQETVIRVSQLEDAAEKSRAEVQNEVREAYRNLGRAWDSITDLLRHKEVAENHLCNIDDHLQSIGTELARIGDRQMELVDVNIALEDRIDNMEPLEDREALQGPNAVPEPSTKPSSHQSTLPSHRRTRETTHPPTTDAHPTPRPRSHSPVFAPATAESSSIPAAAVPDSQEATPAPVPAPVPAPAPALLAAAPMRTASRNMSATSTIDLWTVHVSLLPTSTQPLPFERDTNAYKRCLSRGLLQMVPVSGRSAEAVEQAIIKVFGRILRGRRWAPLQARPCTAERLTGIPMLRPLDPSLLDAPYDLNFLRNHCAVCDINGRIDSLYIAMRNKTLSWRSIWRLPVYLEGLEPAWNYDVLLDVSDPFVDDERENDVNSSEDEITGGVLRPPAGDIVATMSSLKRAASEMSRSSSFGSATTATPAAPSTSAPSTSAPEGEGSRPKVARLFPLPNISEVRRRVRTS